MDNETLRKLQITQLEILKDIDLFCRVNNIEYSLYAGTLLGAVRHKGFIPWDDDIDIAMDRKNYKKFISLWIENPLNGYFLQNVDIDDSFRYSFSKIRKDGTEYIEQNAIKYEKHNGIFIDIFPIDKIPKNYIKKKIHILLNILNLLYLRRYPAKDNGKIIYTISVVLLKIIPDKFKNIIREFCDKHITRHNENKNLNYTDNSTFSNIKLEFDKNLFENFIELEFEGYKFYAFSEYDKYLKIQYGDYMKLPSKEDRTCKHKPIKLIF